MANTGGWNISGPVDRLSNGLYAIREREGQRATSYQDISVSGMAGKRALLMANTYAENVRVGDITGLPYIYGYMMRSNGRIDSYLQGQQMRHSAGSGAWSVSYGIFTIPATTTKIRLMMNQASRRGTIKDGRAAVFYAPGLFVADTDADLQTYLNVYQSQANTLPTPPFSSPAPAPTPPPPVQDACATFGNGRVARSTFETNDAQNGVDARLHFGGLVYSWPYVDYPAGKSIVSATTNMSAYEGGRALGLDNPAVRSGLPTVYDEAVGYNTTGVFVPGQRYRFALRARYEGPGSSVNLTMAKEQHPGDYARVVENSSYMVGSAWTCLTLDTTQDAATPSNRIENMSLFFGTVPPSGKLYVDDMRLVRL